MIVVPRRRNLPPLLRRRRYDLPVIGEELAKVRPSVGGLDYFSNSVTDLGRRRGH